MIELLKDPWLFMRIITSLKRELPDSVKIEADIQDEPVYINGNRPQLSQVLRNLAINARDAMPRGGSVRISVKRKISDKWSASYSAESAVGSAVISIHDTGEGVSTAVRDRVLEPFFTTKPRDRGKGLGLAMVNAIVKDHGGDIEVDSQVGRGASIKITFPLRHDLGDRNAGLGLQPVRARGRGETILVVENNPLVRATVCEALNSDGHKVLQAGDGKEALRVFDDASGSVGLLISDSDLPTADGASVIRTVRETRPDLPVMIITGSGQESLTTKDLRYVTTLRKPFTMAELITAVSQLLHEPV